MQVAAAIATAIMYAIFPMPSVKINTHRFWEESDVIQNSTMRSEFVPISQQVVQGNMALQKAFSCADHVYSIERQAPQFQEVIPPSCDMEISWYDANTIKSTIPVYSFEGGYTYLVEYEGKFHSFSCLDNRMFKQSGT